MGACASKKQEREKKNQYLTSPQQNNQLDIQKNQLFSQEGDINLNNQQNNQGYISYPQSYSNFLKKQKDTATLQNNMRNDEQEQEQIHKYNYNYPLPPNSIVQQQSNPKRCQIECSAHKDMYIELVNTNNTIQQRLMCYQCQFEQKNEKKQIMRIDSLLQMTDKQYLERFLVFQEPLQKELYQQFQTTKEIEISKFNIQFLSDFKVKVIEQVDKQIKAISESMDRLLNKLDDLTRSYQSCNNLNIFQYYLSQGDNQDKLSQNISKLLHQQDQQNKHFEQNLEEYYQMTSKELTFQSSSINTFNSLLYNFIHNNNNIRKDQTNKQLLLQDHIIKRINLLKEISQIEKHDLDTSDSMSVSMNNHLCISLKTNNKKTNINYINTEIMKHKKYSMVLDLKSQDYNNGSVSLYIVPQGDLSRSPFKSELKIPYLSPHNIFNIKIERGVSINTKKSDINNLEIQIDLQNKIFRWKFENNINYIKDWSTYSSNEPYYILFYSFQNPNCSFIIKHLKEVSEFESW